MFRAIADQSSGQEKKNLQTIEELCSELQKISVQSNRRTVFRAREDQCSEQENYSVQSYRRPCYEEQKISVPNCKGPVFCFIFKKSELYVEGQLHT